jgi:hypothetical protein
MNSFASTIRLGMAFVIVLAGVALLRSLDGAPLDRSNESLHGAFDPRVLDPEDPSQPLMLNGRIVTLEEAEKAFGFPVHRPDHVAASDDLISEIWLGTDGQPEIALRYMSGLRVYLTVRPDSGIPGVSRQEDAAAMYQEHASEGGGGGSFEEINGYPAYAVERDAIAEGNPVSSVVALTIGAVEVELWADTTRAELIDIARSIK